LALQKAIRGENLDDVNPALASRYRQYMRTVDTFSEAYEKDRANFIEEAWEEGLSNRPTGQKRAEKQQEVAQRLQHHRANAKLGQAEKKKWMTDQIKNGPKEKIYVEPKIVLGSIGGQPASRVEGYKIGINGVTVYLAPGENNVHPIIADRYRQIQQGKIEDTKRKELLMANKSWKDVAKGMQDLNDEYGSRSGSGGEAGGDWLSPDVYQEF